MLANAAPGSRVLDPFCGRGTTNYAARVLGLHSYGTDTNPVAVAIASAKLASTSVEEVLNLLQQILAGPESVLVPVGPFWEGCYHPTTLQDICKLRDALQLRQDAAAAVLRAVFLGVLHGPRRITVASYLSNQMPRTFASKPAYSVKYWRENNLTPPLVDTCQVIEQKVRRILATPLPPVPGRIDEADARNIPDYDAPIDYIVTSPPYYGFDTYRPDQWLRLWALGFPAEVTYQDETQVSRGGVLGFTKRLAEVWKRVGEISRNKAKLCIRFGSLPSMPVNPLEILEESFELSGHPWFTTCITPVPPLRAKARQATQMGTTARRNNAATEIDVVAILDRR